MTASRGDLAFILDDAIRDAGDRLYAEVDEARLRLPDERRLLDELERTIDDVAETAVQARLRGLLAQLDENRECVRAALDAVSLHQGLDPIRGVAADLTNGFL